MSNGDYILGTGTDEIKRLSIQHAVWRDRVLESFSRAGIRPGMTVIDVGAGPGFVTTDLSSIVGDNGTVLALERSDLFLAELRRTAAANVAIQRHDVSNPFPITGADACWCRWLLSFTPDPALVVRNIAAAIKPGGKAIFHEYAAYSTWRITPLNSVHERFRSLVERSWRDSGGEPDVALSLVGWLGAAGLEIIESRTHADFVRPGPRAWEWPRAFMQTNASRLGELGYLDEDDVEKMATLLDHPPAGSAMLTPLVGEIIAIRRE